MGLTVVIEGKCTTAQSSMIGGEYRAQEPAARKTTIQEFLDGAAMVMAALSAGESGDGSFASPNYPPDYP
ncbi:unnamed protein product [Urochloa humidicola]